VSRKNLRLVMALGGLAAVLLVSSCSSETPTEQADPVNAATAAAEDEGIRVGREPNAPFLVSANDLGIFSGTTQPTVPNKAYLSPCYPNWAADNPQPGEFSWAQSDSFIGRAEQWGYTDILSVFCSTPQWAGKPVEGEDTSVVGPGGAQAPKNLSDWRSYLEAVVKRYKGRISGYSVWNEPASPQFFTGTPKQLAKMTLVLREVVNKQDSAAYVLSAGLQTHREQYREYLEKYLTELAALDWPVDGISVHLYPPSGGTPQTRVETVEWVQGVLTELEAPADLPIWDTEVNYEVSQPGGEPDGRITGQRAAAWTTVSFLDGWRTGVRRTYWYLWTDAYYGFPGIQMRPGDPSTQAMTTLANWVIGAEFRGCEVADRLVDCSFAKDGDFRIAYSTSGNVEVALDSPAEICPVYGGDCTQSAVSVKVNDTPVRIVPGDG
jgi:hypothetical protein